MSIRSFLLILATSVIVGVGAYHFGWRPLLPWQWSCLTFGVLVALTFGWGIATGNRSLFSDGTDTGDYDKN